MSRMGLCLLLLFFFQAFSAPQQARQADPFLDTISTNTHSNYYDTLYNDWDNVTRILREIGIRHIRDGPWAIDRLNSLNQYGIKVNMVIDVRKSDNTLDISRLPELLGDAKKCVNLFTLENPNEYDCTGGDWVTTLKQWVQEMWKDVQADSQLKPFPVVAPSFCRGDSPQQLGDVSAFVSKGNMHSYPGGQPPTNGLSNNINNAKLVAGSVPITATETGYHSALNKTSTWDQPGISDTAGGKYFPRLHFEYWNSGVERTYCYELLDQWDDPTKNNSEADYGLVHYDWSYKPAATALKNLFSILSDPGSSFNPGTLDFSLTGTLTNVHWSLLQKRDGSYYLSLWQEVNSFDQNTQKDINNPSLPVNVSINGSGFSGAQLYRPLQGNQPIQNFSSLQNIALQVPDEVVILRVK